MVRQVLAALAIFGFGVVGGYLVSRGWAETEFGAGRRSVRHMGAARGSISRERRKGEE